MKMSRGVARVVLVEPVGRWNLRLPLDGCTLADCPSLNRCDGPIGGINERLSLGCGELVLDYQLVYLIDEILTQSKHR